MRASKSVLKRTAANATGTSSGRPSPHRATAAAAPATAANARDLFLGTAEGNWTSMGVLSDGSYGVPEGLVSSFPVTTGNGDWSIVPDLEVSEFSRGHIARSVAELESERDAVRGLGLI